MELGNQVELSRDIRSVILIMITSNWIDKMRLQMVMTSLKLISNMFHTQMHLLRNITFHGVRTSDARGERTILCAVRWNAF